MRCPYCSNGETRVTNKRDMGDGMGTRRRRECLKCKKRFTTHESIAQESNLYIIKKDKRREKFDREKLERGVEKAFEKRPVSKEKIDKMVKEIEEQLMKRGKREIQSSAIGEMVMKKLKKIDNVAYIRFASVYRNFQDVNDFRKEIRGMK
jgi:transcriptional repressor NrdR